MSRKNHLKTVLSLIITLLISLSFFTVCFAHPGNTDSKGGHNDNENDSGLGSYHYHCNGNPAHLHENGACPYSQTQPTTNNTEVINSQPTLSVKQEKTTLKEDETSLFPNCSSIDLIIETVPTVSFFGKSYYSLTKPIYFTVVTDDSDSDNTTVQISVQNGTLEDDNKVNPLTPGSLIIRAETDELMTMKVLDIVNFPLLELQIYLIIIIAVTLICYIAVCICRFIINRQVKKRLCSV
ncbi:MAG: YHYH domain-containing protein [Clostridia bacterium]|nr:YHYH domain-containing protein [Clostridia bacterium]